MPLHFLFLLADRRWADRPTTASTKNDVQSVATDNAMLLHSCGHLMGAKFGNHMSDVNEKCPERTRPGWLHDFHTDIDYLLAASGAERILLPVPIPVTM